MRPHERRLIEDMLPIAAINEVAASEKAGGRLGHDVAPVVGAPVHDAVRLGGPEAVIDQARREVLVANGGVPPKVLDLFARVAGRSRWRLRGLAARPPRSS